VKVNAKLYDASDTLIGTESSYIDLDIIMPGEKSPFSILVTNSIPIDHYKLKIIDYDITTEQPYRNLQILSYSDSIDVLGWMHVVGEVKNNGSETVEYVMILATFYDSDGKVVVTEWTFTEEDEIAPGETGTFELLMIYSDLVPQIDHYTLQVQGSPK